MMANKKKNGSGNGVKKNRNHYPGRPSMCEKIPGEGACLKQLKSSRPRLCINCNAPEIQTIKIQVFGRK